MLFEEKHTFYMLKMFAYILCQKTSLKFNDIKPFNFEDMDNF